MGHQDEGRLQGAVGELDDRRARAAHNQGLFREVNERIDELGERWVSDEAGQYVCECLDTNCAELVVGLSRDEYRRIRLDAAEFVVLPGHERVDVEEIVMRTPRWLIVRKVGVGAEIAERLADQVRRSAGSERRVG